MGWMLACVILAGTTVFGAGGSDFEVRLSERAIGKVVRGIFPLRHETRLAAPGADRVAIGWKVTLSDPVVRIDPAGVRLNAKMRVSSGRQEAGGPARFLLRPRYDRSAGGLRFEMVDSEVDLEMRGVRLGTFDLSWVAQDLFVPLSYRVEGGNGPIRVDVVPEVAVRRGEILMRGRIDVRRRIPSRGRE